MDANTTFPLDLLNVLAAEAGRESLFISPLSISNALAITWAGAVVEAEREMAGTLRFTFEQVVTGILLTIGLSNWREQVKRIATTNSKGRHCGLTRKSGYKGSIQNMRGKDQLKMKNLV